MQRHIERSFWDAASAARSHERVVVLGAVALTTLAALVLRLNHLGSHSLWLDEVITAETVRFGTIGEALGWARIWVDNTPLLFLLTWLLAPLGGSEVAVRLPLAIAGTLTVPAIYALGQAVASRSVGLVAAVLLAVAPFAVYYSQEARAYALVMLFTTLQMLFAYRVALRPGRWDWLGLALFTALALHASHFGLATTSAAFAWMAVTLWLERPGRRSPSREPMTGEPGPTVRSRATLASLALAVAVVAYLPILPILFEFLGRSDLGFGRLAATGSLSADTAVVLLAALDARGPALLLAVVGSIVALYRSIRLADRGALLLVAWVALPVIGMFVLSRGQLQAILPRYFAFLYPAVVVLTALGLAALARILATAAARILEIGPAAKRTAMPRVRSVTAVAFAAITLALLLTDRYSAVVRSYETPKGEDNRAAVEAIVAASRPGSTVVALGRNQEWLIETIGYYLWLQRSPVEVFKGGQPGDRGLARAQRPGDLWGIVLDSWNEVPPEPPTGASFQHVGGLTMVRLPDDGSSQLDRFERLLTWASTFDPGSAGTQRLLGLLRRAPSDAGNLVPPPARSEADGQADGTAVGARWVLRPGATIDPDGTQFVLRPTDGEVNLTFSTDSALAGGEYAITFRCRGAPGSNPRVYVSEGTVADLSASAVPLPVYPNGAGYGCPSDGDWTTGGFLFTLPSPANITVWLRDAGPEASFEAVRLEAVP